MDPEASCWSVVFMYPSGEGPIRCLGAPSVIGHWGEITPHTTACTAVLRVLPALAPLVLQSAHGHCMISHRGLHMPQQAEGVACAQTNPPQVARLVLDFSCLQLGSARLPGSLADELTRAVTKHCDSQLGIRSLTQEAAGFPSFASGGD